MRYKVNYGIKLKFTDKKSTLWHIKFKLQQKIDFFITQCYYFLFWILFYNYVLLHTMLNINLPIKQQKTLHYWISLIWENFFISYCIIFSPHCFHLCPTLSPISISRLSHSHLRSTYRGSCYGRWLRAKWLKRFQKLEQEREGDSERWGREVTGVTGGNPLRWSQQTPAVWVELQTEHTPLLAGIQLLGPQIEREREIEKETRGGETARGMQGMR